MGEKNPLPTRTPEQRKVAMAMALYARRERAAFKAACKAGNIPPEAAVKAPIANRMKVEQFVQSFPGIGKAKTVRILEETGARPGSRVGRLGYRQEPRLVEAIKGSMTVKGGGENVD